MAGLSGRAVMNREGQQSRGRGKYDLTLNLTQTLKSNKIKILTML